MIDSLVFFFVAFSNILLSCICRYYVSHLEDLYGGLFNPSLIYDYYWSARLMTHLAVIVEMVCPVLLWFERTRKPALVVVVLFHIGMALGMNLNCFQYIMIVGWLSFLVQPQQNTALSDTTEDNRQLRDTSDLYGTVRASVVPSVSCCCCMERELYILKRLLEGTKEEHDDLKQKLEAPTSGAGVANKP